MPPVDRADRPPEGRFRGRIGRSEGFSDAPLRRGGVAAIRFVEKPGHRRWQAKLAEFDASSSLPRIQSQTHRGSEERARLRLCGVEQQAGCLCGLRRGRRRPRGGAVTAACHRAAVAPIRSAVHILFPDYLAVVKDGKKLGELDHLNQTARQMLDQLAWWAGALKTARETTLRQAA